MCLSLPPTCFWEGNVIDVTQTTALTRRLAGETGGELNPQVLGTMAKFGAWSLLFQAVLVSAAPAVIWKKSASRGSLIHSSDNVDARKLLESVLTPEPPRDDSLSYSSVTGVVFLVGRGNDGAENFSKLAADGVLPGVADKYKDAHCIHHHVSGIEGPHSLVKEATSQGLKVAEASLDEYESRIHNRFLQETVDTEANVITGKQNQRALQRQRKIAQADVLVVKVPANTDPSKIDSVVSGAIDNVDTVVLTGVRSYAEILLERDNEARRIRKLQEKNGRKILADKTRRLEENQGNNNNNGGNNGNMSNVYYVSMTPNILAGILFTILFATITWIGVSCMGAISGQDVYVKKMPSIGREA